MHYASSFKLHFRYCQHHRIRSIHLIGKMTINLTEKYEQERKKRQQVSKGLGQYLDKERSAGHTLSEDPWIPAGTPMHRPVPEGGHVKIIIIGAGFAGVVAAIKCLDAGAAKSPDDILIIDPAGGFGGTWYWYVKRCRNAS